MSPMKEKIEPIDQSPVPDVKEDPNFDNTERPPGDWQVEPDPAEPPPADENGNPIPGAPENPPEDPNQRPLQLV